MFGSNADDPVKQGNEWATLSQHPHSIRLSFAILLPMFDPNANMPRVNPG